VRLTTPSGAAHVPGHASPAPAAGNPGIRVSLSTTELEDLLAAAVQRALAGRAAPAAPALTQPQFLQAAPDMGGSPARSAGADWRSAVPSTPVPQAFLPPRSPPRTSVVIDGAEDDVDDDGETQSVYTTATRVPPPTETRLIYAGIVATRFLAVKQRVQLIPATRILQRAAALFGARPPEDPATVSGVLRQLALDFDGTPSFCVNLWDWIARSSGRHLAQPVSTALRYATLCFLTGTLSNEDLTTILLAVTPTATRFSALVRIAQGIATLLHFSVHWWATVTATGAAAGLATSELPPCCLTTVATRPAPLAAAAMEAANTDAGAPTRAASHANAWLAGVLAALTPEDENLDAACSGMATILGCLRARLQDGGSMATASIEALLAVREPPRRATTVELAVLPDRQAAQQRPASGRPQEPSAPAARPAPVAALPSSSDLLRLGATGYANLVIFAAERPDPAARQRAILPPGKRQRDWPERGPDGRKPLCALQLARVPNHVTPDPGNCCLHMPHLPPADPLPPLGLILQPAAAQRVLDELARSDSVLARWGIKPADVAAAAAGRQ